jgi:hypothetical protein
MRSSIPFSNAGSKALARLAAVLVAVAPIALALRRTPGVDLVGWVLGVFRPA